MTSLLTRYIGVACAALALATVAAWIIDRAPIPPQDTWSVASNDAVRYRIVLDFSGTAADAVALRERLNAAGIPTRDVPQYEDRMVSFPFIGEQHWIGRQLTDPDRRARQFIVAKDYTLRDASLAAAAIERQFPQVRHHIDVQFEGPNPYLYFHLGRDGIGRALIWGLGLVMPSAWPSALALSLLAASISVAALLGIFLLMRGGDAPAIGMLATGLACWALGIAELWLYSVAPTFERLQFSSLAIGMAADVAAFLLLLFASAAFVRFWYSFPRSVTETELDAFLATLDVNSAGAAGSIKGRLSHVLSYLGGIGPGGKGGRRVKRLTILVLVLLSALLWRGGFLIAKGGTVWGELPLVPLVALVLIIYAPGVVCLRLFKFHDITGTDEDRRQVEWMRAGLWMGFVAFLVPVLGLAALYLLRLVFPEVDLWIVWAICFVIFGLLSGPLIVMGALALSILYRGTLDPRLALRGLTMWSVLGVLLTLLFVLVERSIALRLVTLLGMPPQSGYIAAGAFVAATFQPVRKRVERRVNRFVERVLPETMLAAGNRRPAAVAIVDISGYTALSATDEQAALIASAVLQKEAKRIAEAGGGRLVKTTGDGVILSFTDCSRALAAVRELHASVTRRARSLDIMDIMLHSGLHWGQIVEMHDGDIYGQTVNVTARLADWARRGEIGVSEVFCLALSEPVPDFIPQGPQRFKNVPEPIACYRLATG